MVTAMRGSLLRRGRTSPTASFRAHPPDLWESETQLSEFRDLLGGQHLQAVVAERNNRETLSGKLMGEVRLRAIEDVQCGSGVSVKTTARRFKGAACEVAKQ